VVRHRSELQGRVAYRVPVRETQGRMVHHASVGGAAVEAECLRAVRAFGAAGAGRPSRLMPELPSWAAMAALLSLCVGC